MPTLTLTVNIPDEHAEAFRERMRGDDDDVILAAERAMNAALELDYSGERIEVERAEILTD
jgi:hypothetical protein